LPLLKFQPSYIPITATDCCCK